MTVEIYIVMVNDRHTDPEPYLFSTREAAMDLAQREAVGWLVVQEPAPDGWLFFATHETEDDSVWVIVRTVDDPELQSEVTGE